MAARRKGSKGLEAEQALATDPFADAALSASAGTGKTHVLTSRVFRLLLNGAAPETILCLTFTKAGAAAMAERIGTRLARWVLLSNSDLGAELEALGESSGHETRERARQLFARVLDAPGGIRIQTIHAFAQSLLAAFPAEAGVSSGFQPIEGRAADELVHRTLADLMADAESSGNEALIGDVQALSRRLGERGAVDYLRLCAGREEEMRKLNPATIEAELRTQMGAPDCDIDQFLADHCSDDQFDCALLQAIADANRGWGKDQGLKHSTAIESWLQMPSEQRANSLSLIRGVVLTGEGTLRKVHGQTKHDPDYEAKSETLAQAVAELLAIQNACALASDMAAGLRAGQAFAAAYARAKRAAGVADFNDLITWTRNLLKQQEMTEWVRFKLDRRIDHLLVDEAQDTNADQWAIISSVVEDFYAGSSDGDARWRTLLMVGDYKQAIYGFQGTDPREFEKVRAEFKAKADALATAESEADDGVRQAREFHDLSMATSFRSAQGVLDAVDAMIDVVGWQAMGLPRAPERHRAAAKNAGLPATVELWAPFAPELGDNEQGGDDDDEEGWIGLRERRYAERLADQVSQWTNSSEVLGSTGQPVRPGDVLILVRSRRELASLIVARLFEAGVPVAGIDRIHLHKPLAVQDLLAAMTFAIQPLDDLNLANLLVSPLVGWSQEQLLALAWDRKGQRLWPRLRKRAERDSDAAVARDLLLQLLNMADYTTPTRFLETVLTGPIGGRRKLAKRLTMAARDPIDELMSSALQFERDDLPSLERFLAWFRRGDVEIARDPSAPANEVRVMTVHGAKGLEAPVVILADAHADPARLGRPGPIDTMIGDARVPVVRPRKAELIDPFAQTVAARQKADLEEHLRLLYVGMTRAIDRLVVAGLEPKGGKLPPNSWHGRVGEAFDRLSASEDQHGLWGSVRRYTSSGRPAKALASTSQAPAVPLEIPAWASRPAPIEERPPRPLSPSSIAKDDVAAPPPSLAQRAAAQRGTWIHALLERLVDVASDRRRAVAERWLEQSAGVTDGGERAAIAEQVCAILSSADYAPLFGPGSLGEAPLAATLADGRVIAGTVDRLLVEKERISVIDFKTGWAPPSEEDIPAAHRAQMDAYAAALAVIFPGRAVRTALLYTAGPRLFELRA